MEPPFKINPDLAQGWDVKPGSVINWTKSFDTEKEARAALEWVLANPEKLGLKNILNSGIVPCAWHKGDKPHAFVVHVQFMPDQRKK